MRLRIICTSAGNFEFTYTSAGNFYAQVLVNAYTEFYIPGKYIPLTKTIKKFVKTMQKRPGKIIYWVTKNDPVKPITG